MSLKHWRYRLPWGCTVLVASVALAACGEQTAARDRPVEPAVADGYPVTVENCGRTLTFERAPSRVMLNYHPVAEIFVGLGLADRAIGRAGYEGALEGAPLLREQAAAFNGIPVVSDNNYPPPKEKLLTLRPDFVLSYGVFDFGGKTEGKPGLATIEELEAAGAKSYLATCPDDEDDPGGGFGADTLAATYQTILDLGKIFNVRERAQQRVDEMKAQIAEVHRKVSADPPLNVFIYSRGTGPVEAVGGEGLITEILTAAGGRNVFSDGKIFFETSLESVAARPADAYLIFADYEKAAQSADFLFKTFPNMPASQARRYAVTEYTYRSPGWRIAQTVEDVARQLHPEAFNTPSQTQQYTDANGGG